MSISTYNYDYDMSYPFRPTTALDLLIEQAEEAVAAVERAHAAYRATSPVENLAMTEVDSDMEDSEFEDDTTDLSVHVQLGDHKIVVEFESEDSREDVQAFLATDLSGYADPDTSLTVGPLIIPARLVPGITFASVRTLNEAQDFNVHLYGNGGK